MEKEFKKGQLVAYCPTDARGKIYKVEIGVFSKYTKDKRGAFIWYHMGGTCACTPIEHLYPVENDNYIVIGHTFNSLDKEGNENGNENT